ncbi:MAG: glycosyltransferase family 2 protein [Gemmatimonadales bacterium]
MSNTISVVTAVHAPGAQYLFEAYESLRTQELPAGWKWEWLVQEDGETGAIAAKLPTDDDRVKLGVGRPGGPGVARTSALSRATGTVVKTLDADDVLTPGALARDIAILEQMPNVHWTTSRALDLLPDGSTYSWAHADPAEGIIPQGWVLESWQKNDWLLPIHPVTMCMRRDLLLALGGWMALTAAEDTGLIIAASVVADGYFIAEPSLLYRKHPTQVTAQDHHLEPVERQRRRDLIVARAEAVRRVFDLKPAR